MRYKTGCAALALMLGLGVGPALAQSGEITVWSWNVAASSLESVIAGFNEQYPDVTVSVEDLGNQQVFDRTLAGCAAGGSGLPDVLSIETHEAEIFWAQFPDCFADLAALGYSDDIAAGFPDFKRTELEVGDVRYAMPWDSGPVVMFYRRDFYENAGVDPDGISTWDDFIAAGTAVMEANPGVVMTQADFNGDTEWFRMLSNEQGCGYFSNDGETITVNAPSGPIDLAALPWDDPGVFALLQRGDTIGVFQVESAGMRKALIGMKPDRIEDIIALVALVVIGPLWRIARLGVTLVHELGHALGWRHLEGRASVMNPRNPRTPTAFDRAGAAIAFQRPPLNRSPDVDASPATINRLDDRIYSAGDY